MCVFGSRCVVWDVSLLARSAVFAMADDKSLSDTRQLLLQAIERMDAVAPSASSSSEKNAPTAYPYRPITRQVNFHDVGNRRRLSLSLNTVRNRDVQQEEQPGPSRPSQLLQGRSVTLCFTPQSDLKPRNHGAWICGRGALFVCV